MNFMDVSILIVHYNIPGLLRQTLKGIRRAKPALSYEVIVVDNNPGFRISDELKEEFSEVKWILNDKNSGFGAGMNLAMKHANGEYFLIYNPDIILKEGTLETLHDFMKENSTVGIVGPKLVNPDGSLQHSCYRFMKPEMILYRRVPLLNKLPFAKKSIDSYVMKDWDHSTVSNVDYLLGAALFVRASAVKDVGPFDENFFMYFEDQDWCRRFWEAGYRVVYLPKAECIHYHRRETAEGSFLAQLFNPLTRIQIKSALYYYKKYRKKEILK